MNGRAATIDRVFWPLTLFCETFTKITPSLFLRENLRPLTRYKSGTRDLEQP